MTTIQCYEVIFTIQGIQTPAETIQIQYLFTSPTLMSCLSSVQCTIMDTPVIWWHSIYYLLSAGTWIPPVMGATCNDPSPWLYKWVVSSGMWGTKTDDCTKTRDKRISHQFVGAYKRIIPNESKWFALQLCRKIPICCCSPGKFPGLIFIENKNADVELALQRPGAGAQRETGWTRRKYYQQIWIKHKNRLQYSKI